MGNVMLDKVGPNVTVGGGGVAVVSGLTSHDWGVIIGVFLGVCGLALQIYRTRVDIKHKATMAEQDREFKEFKKQLMKKKD